MWKWMQSEYIDKAKIELEEESVQGGGEERERRLGVVKKGMGREGKIIEWVNMERDAE